MKPSLLVILVLAMLWFGGIEVEGRICRDAGDCSTNFVVGLKEPRECTAGGGICICAPTPGLQPTDKGCEPSTPTTTVVGHDAACDATNTCDGTKNMECNASKKCACKDGRKWNADTCEVKAAVDKKFSNTDGSGVGPIHVRLPVTPVAMSILTFTQILFF